jgi:hypothetical protein
MLEHQGLCRNIAFSRLNSTIVYWKINDFRVQTVLFSVICDRAPTSPANIVGTIAHCPSTAYRHYRASLARENTLFFRAMQRKEPPAYCRRVVLAPGHRGKNRQFIAGG